STSTMSFVLSLANLENSNVNKNGATMAISMPIENNSQNPSVMEMTPGTPPTPTLYAVSMFAPKSPPTTDVVSIAAMNGYFSGRLTPNIAGSVTPSQPEIPEVIARPSSFFFLFLR